MMDIALGWDVSVILALASQIPERINYSCWHGNFNTLVTSMIMAVENSLDVVMLVDDNSTDNFIAKRIIEVTGFANKVIVTSSCSEALAYLIVNQFSTDDLPEIIFLDINMPLHDGFDFLKRFHALDYSITSRCKVIILSSSDHREDIERILSDDHVIKFMTKPLSEAGLEEIHFKNA